MQKPQYTLPLETIRLHHLPQVGGKNASLGEMIQMLTDQGIRVPSGFAITVNAYYDFIEYNGLHELIWKLIEQTDFNDIGKLRQTGSRIRQAIANGTFSGDLKAQIEMAYVLLSQEYEQNATDVAVRSSATAEDLPDASFAGQQDTYLNIRGSEALMHAVKNCFASLFTDRALSYRESLGYNHLEVGLSVGVQKMVRSDLGASGVAFSLDTESGFKDVVLINGSYGLGETIVQGTISPDEFLVFKPALAKGFPSIIERKLGNKQEKMIYSSDAMKMTQVVPVNEHLQHQFCIPDEVVLELAEWVTRIEDYYSAQKDGWYPMDVEWAYDGLKNQLYIVQARPETIHSRKKHGEVVRYHIEVDPAKAVLQGIAVGDGIGTGNVRVLHSLDQRHEGTDPEAFREGDVLVTEMTDPDWEPLMKKASAIVTNKGGRTCHAAIVAREMGIPAIVGTQTATEVLQEATEITVSCAEGDVGRVYAGTIDYEVEKIDLNQVPAPQTPIMLNVASPDLAFQFSHLPNAGVGLAREEFIINNYIQAHPLALLHHRELGDRELSERIEQLTRGYDSEEDFFVEKLSHGIAKIGAAFYPNKVIVRFSDFKSNEYANLLGGKHFEPSEENPMIGWRGASRYYSEQYKQAFGMECKAIARVREVYGLENIVVMIPFCRTVQECTEVLKTMAEFGLHRGKNGLEVYLMAELPSNIIMAEAFAEHIDGFSIGSNDLTQLTLGLDRDSSLVAYLYDERNEAVKTMISYLIRAARRTGTKVGICGQGPSDFPDFAQFLVESGIDSISVTPDALLKTRQSIHAIESESQESDHALEDAA